MTNEEQYKAIEQRFVEAANQFNYPATEDAWKKMELLLNEEDKKPRGFLWIVPLLLILILGVSVGIYKLKNNNNAKPTAELNTFSNNNDSKQNNPITDTSNTINALAQNKNSIKDVNNPHPPQLAAAQKPAQADDVIAEKAITKNKQQVFNNKRNIKIDITASAAVDDADAKKRSIKKIKKPTSQSYSKKAGASSSINVSNTDSSFTKQTIIGSSESKTTVAISEPSFDVDKDSSAAVDSKNRTENNTLTASTSLANDTSSKTNNNLTKVLSNKNKTKQNLLQKLFVVGNIGAEINSTKRISLGNSQPVLRYGGNIGVNLGKRWAITAGFYKSVKKYVAQKSDYKFTGNYWNTVDVQSIDADCIVHEIPLMLQYKFFESRNSSLIAGAGASAFLMKKEDYIYNLFSNNYYYSTARTFTGNKHLLATANIMLGIEQRISNKIRLQLTPKLNIPLGGVGQGEIKLNSASIDAGIRYFPFLKKN
jgi:hypothetical protein